MIAIPASRVWFIKIGELIFLLTEQENVVNNESINMMKYDFMIKSLKWIKQSDDQLINES